MAVIECVVNFDEASRQFFVATHIFEADGPHRFELVTNQPKLALQSKHEFPPLKLRKNEIFNPTYREHKPETKRDDKALKFMVIYHGPRGDFLGGSVDSAGVFQPYMPRCTVCLPGGYDQE
jgi:hypothetical protein